jgi:hypothetical protein
MSENLISENENAASNAPTAQNAEAETATKSEAEVTETQKTEIATEEATTAVIKIEGQEFPLDVAIAGDDNLLKAALSPHYPSIKNAQISRETRLGEMIVSIVKKAEHKGMRGEERR